MKSVVFFAVPVTAVTFGSVSSTKSPVERIVNLLKDLKGKTEADGKAEQRSYEKFACWCEQTTARKSAAIGKAIEDLHSLGQSILKLKGTVAIRTAEIDQLKKDIKETLDLQADATNVREKENTEFRAETAEEKQAIAALQKAIEVLIVGTKQSSFLQESAAVARNAVKEVLQVLPANAGLKGDHISLLSSFSTSGYSPQSETIQGILRDMYETMASNLESATSSEAESNREYERFMSDSNEQLDQLRTEKATKESEKATAEKNLADTTETYTDTEKQKEADIEFFDTTKSSCQTKSDEWDVRRNLRDEELDGISKAIEILTSDDARALFASSIKAGKETFFLQVSSTGSASAAKAYEHLKLSARKAHSLRLAELAVRVQQSKAGHFDEVISQINKMLSDLQQEGADDIKKRDQCKSEYQTQSSSIANIEWLIEKNLAKIDKLERNKAKRTAEKEETIVAISETKEQIAAMKKQRKEEHEAFLHAKKEDEETVDLLTQARDALTSYSKKNGIDLGPIQGSVAGVLVQKEPVFDVSEDQAPDVKFSGKGSRKQQTKGIVGLMSMLLEDAQDEIKNGIANEASAQAEFDKQLKAAETLLEGLETKKENLSEQIAYLGEKISEENTKMSENNHELTDEKDYLAKITPDCDWIIGAFEKRAAARAAEMDGLSGAKESLVGAA